VTLRTRLVVCQLGLSTVPVVVVAALVVWQAQSALTHAAKQAEAGLQDNTAHAREALTNLQVADLVHTTQNLHAMCAAQQEALQQTTTADLEFTRSVLAAAGPVRVDAETVTWSAVHPTTAATTSLALPRMYLGDTWIQPNDSFETPAPVVDEVKRRTGAICTLFQRMNPAGDMLRVCTSVSGAEGKRAQGTYMRAAADDGTPDPVIAAVLHGMSHRGRVSVAKAWYLATYEPLTDAAGQVVGMFCVGLKEADLLGALRQTIMQLKIGKTGYVYVLNAHGAAQGHYVISKDGARDGENIWNAKDADGKLFIQQICQTALALAPGAIGDARYPWKNAGDTAPRYKMVKIAYFQPWDWVIGVGAYEDEVFEPVAVMGTLANETLAALTTTRQVAVRALLMWPGVIAGVAICCAATLAFLIARGISRPVEHAIRSLGEGSAQVDDAARQLSSTSQDLASGSSKQASSLEEISAALQEMAAIARDNSNKAAAANELASQTQQNAAEGDTTMVRLNAAMAAINESSSQIRQVIKVSEEIAFQTNLLALNAAVEAARAGEHGKGFAIVAEEVRNLAQRSAQAARDTTDLIEGSVVRVREGSGVADSATTALRNITTNVTQAAELLTKITDATNKQASGIEHINDAVAHVDQVTQQCAAGAQESASASEELSAQATTLKGVVRALAYVVHGGNRVEQTRD
jgi:methyl-accepting chemotaxis protein